MPLSKAKNRERVKQARATCVQPNLEAHLRVYPEYLEKLADDSYDLNLDPYYNPLLSINPMPNCKDGRYRST